MNKRVDENIRKYCFDYCRLGNFSEDLIEKLGKKFGISDLTVKSFIEKYINGLDDEERKYYLEVWNANDETVALYNKLGLPIENTTTDSRNEFLQKFFYDLGESVNRDMERVWELAESLGVKRHLIVKYYNGYVYELNKEKTTVEKKKGVIPKLEYSGLKSPKYKTLYRLVDADDEKVIIDILDRFSISVSEFLKEIPNFMAAYRNLLPEIDMSDLEGKGLDWEVFYKEKAKRVNERVTFLKEKEKELIKKLEWYAKYKSDQKRLDTEKRDDILGDILDIYQYENAKKVIEDYLENNGNNNVDFYCKMMGITRAEFNKNASIVREHNPELYEKYSKMANVIKASRYMALLGNVKKIINYIKYGIEEDGVRREFDILDYRSMTKLSFEEMSKFISDNNSRLDLSNDDIKTIRIFIAKNRKFTAYTNRKKEVFVNSTIIMKVKIGDKEELKEFTKDELQAVIDYLETHKLPVNDKTTNLVCRKYASGKLDIFANNSKKKK